MSKIQTVPVKLHHKVFSKLGWAEEELYLLKLFLITLSITFVMANLLAGAFFAGRILPGVKLGNTDLSYQSSGEATGRIAGYVSPYKLHLRVNDQEYAFKPNQFGATFDAEATYRAAYNTGRVAFLPLFSLFTTKTEVPLVFDIDQKKLDKFANKFGGHYINRPRNAAVVIRGGEARKTPAIDGRGIDTQLLKFEIKRALLGRDPLVVRKNSVLKASVTEEELAPLIDKANHFLASQIELKYSGSKVFHPSKSDIGKWISYQVVNEQPRLSISKAKVAAYVAALAKRIDVPARDEHVTVFNHVRKVEQAGKKGLGLEQPTVATAIINAVNSGTPLSLDLPRKPINFNTIYNNQPTLDQDQYISVDLSQQHLWVFDHGQVVYDSPITSGRAGMESEIGIFSIYTKEASRYLQGVDDRGRWKVFVDYWMPFNGEAGLHDADWRSNFGSPAYVWDGSHGCINLPQATAEWIWNWSRIGTTVWVHS